MRKYIRYGFRIYAEKNGNKPSAFVHDAWERYMIQKVGYGARLANKLHGTKPAYKWR